MNQAERDGKNGAQLQAIEDEYAVFALNLFV
jgi:hypothetical protein